MKNINKLLDGKPPREHFLKSNEVFVKRLYKLNDEKLHYDPESRYILVGDVPFDKVVRKNILNDEKLVDKVIREWEKKKEAILKAQKEFIKKYSNSNDTPEQELISFFNTHFDLEMLYMDNAIDAEYVYAIIKEVFKTESNRIPKASRVIMCPSDGKSFFEESNIIRLLHLGYQLSKKSPTQLTIFDDKDKQWYYSNGITRYSIGQMINGFNEVLENMDSEIEKYRGMYSINDVKDCYDQIKEMRIEQMRRRSEFLSINKKVSSYLQKHCPDNLHYLKFVDSGLIYNEENRLIRSKSMFYFTKKAIDSGINPLELFTKALKQREMRGLQR